MRLTRFGQDCFTVDLTPGPLRYRTSWRMRLAEWLRTLMG